MKSRFLVVVTLAAVIGIVSCRKDIGSCPGSSIYNKWQVNTITIKSFMFPGGITYDTTYNAQSGDFIDLSTKGKIVFNINQQQHIDTYDTAQYDLLTDTLVPVTISDNQGNNYVVLTNGHTNHPTLEEKSFGIDTESEIFYDLEK